MKKLIALLLFTLIFSAIGSSVPPGDKMTFKPGIAFMAQGTELGAQSIGFVVNHKGCFASLAMTHYLFRIEPAEFKVNPKDCFASLAMTYYSIKTEVIENRAFAIGSNSTTTTRIATDAETYLNQRKFLIYPVYNRSWRRS